MSPHACMALALATALAGCAVPQNPDFAARSRPLEERCVRAQVPKPSNKPGLTQAESQAEAQAAARRGGLDKALDWLLNRRTAFGTRRGSSRMGRVDPRDGPPPLRRLGVHVYPQPFPLPAPPPPFP